MRAQFVTVPATLLLCLAAASGADSLLVEPSALEGVMKTIQGDNALENPRLDQDATGRVRFLGAPSGSVFDTGSIAKSGTADAVAQSFLAEHAAAFDLKDGSQEWNSARVRRVGDRTYVRMQQLYGGVPVFGAYVNVQLDSEGRIVCIASDLLTDAKELDGSSSAVTPSVLPKIAQQAAIAAIAAENPAISPGILEASEPELVVYDPHVVGNKGAARLTWKLGVVASDLSVAETVFVDAHSGEVALHYNSMRSALYRVIWDGLYFTGLGTEARIVREEGDFPTNDMRNANSNGVPVADADFCYDYLKDTYDFYFEHHGRDSFDNLGSVLYAAVRAEGIFGGGVSNNAAWVGEGFPESNFTPGMIIGTDIVSDDIVAHEYTHGVTGSESDLIYLNESGAINESFSDIWGEFVDLDNGVARSRSRGSGQHVDWETQVTTDASAHRWRMGEDSRFGINPFIGIRDMKEPWTFEDPDRYLSGRYFIGFQDNGGVHSNCGVGNKLCQLLTDGGAFGWAIRTTASGFFFWFPGDPAPPSVLHGPIGPTGEIIWQIEPMGMEKVAALFYEVQTNLLVPSATYKELGFALMQAAINLSLDEIDPELRFTIEDVNNIGRACLGVQLFETTDLEVNPVRNFRAMPIAGERDIVLKWDSSLSLNYQGMRIVRQVGRFPSSPSDGMVVVDSYNDYRYGNLWVDKDLVLGTEYFYGVFAQVYRGDINNNGFLDAGDIDLQVDYGRATVGEELPDFLSESFKSGEMDLAYTQILYTPFVDPGVADDSGQPADYTNYTNYKATIQRPVYELPVDKDEYVRVPMTDDGYVDVPFEQTIPYFGNYASSISLSANGWMAANGVYEVDYLTDPKRRDYRSFQNIWPTLHNHFELPRVDFLFADLAPHTGGEVWTRSMDDRIVVTFEKVPEHGTALPNTVQVEMFYSGHIRCTYLELNVQDAVVGLSDGKGVPLSPKDIATGQPFPKVLSSDLSNLPVSSTFTLLPIPNFFVSEGDTVQFHAEVDDTSGGAVSIWLEDVPPPIDREAIFEKITDTKYRFTWVTNERSGGSYTFKVCAAHGAERICQFVRIQVADPLNLPVAFDLDLSWPSSNPGTPLNSDPLVADYTYYQEDNLPEGLAEIRWYRNDVDIPWLFNQRVVPAYATEPGQKWYFTVLPRASGMEDTLVGDLAISEMVYVGSDDMPDVNKDGGVGAVDIQLVVNAAIGKTVANASTDVNHSGKTNAVDVQVVVNKAVLF